MEIPIVNGGVSAEEWAKLLPGIWFFDPGFMSTAACESSITYLDGDAGILRYRGYPIEQLAESSTYLEVAYLLLNGELPNEEQFAAWKHDVTYHTFIHENVRKRFLEGFHYDAHPMGMLVSAVAALSTFYLDAKDIFDLESRNKQIIRLIAKMPTLAAAAHRFSVGMPFVYPDNTLDFAPNFLSMLWKVAEPRFEADPVLARALDVLFILHADHEQNCSTTAMRVVGSSHSDPYSATAAAAAALYGPRHGGANEAVIRMLTDIGSIENVPDFIATVKAGTSGQRLQGFGHRVYKSYDPRATIIKRTADEVFEVTGKNPLLDIALKLEEIALNDEYFTSRRLYPNVDFYSGLIYQAMGFPLEMFPVLFAIPRTSGWLAHWQEMLDQDSKISRPRQLYIGSEERNYVPIASRSSRRRRVSLEDADETLLDERDAQVAPPVEEEAARQATSVGGDGRVGVVEEPFVGPERPVEPHAVVQAGAHQVLVAPAQFVWGEDRVHEGHVGRVGRHARVQQRIVGQCAVRPDPQALLGVPRFRRAPGELADVALVDRVWALEPVGQFRRSDRAPVVGRASAGSRARAHRAWGTGAPGPVLVLEGGLEIEDGPPVLDGDHAAGGERAPVADPVHLVEDGHGRVAGPEEVGVQRVHLAVFDGAPGGHERLAGHLAAEDALAVLVGLDATEDVDLDRLEVQQVDEEVQGRAHAPMFAARRQAEWQRGQSTAQRPPLPCGGVTPTASSETRRAHVPRRVHVGRGDGGPPDRGWQRQQRLVGVGARPELGHGRTERRRL